MKGMIYVKQKVSIFVVILVLIFSGCENRGTGGDNRGDTLSGTWSAPDSFGIGRGARGTETIFEFSGNQFTMILYVATSPLNRTIFNPPWEYQGGGRYRNAASGTFSITVAEIEPLVDGAPVVLSFSRTENTIEIGGIRFTRG